MYHLKTEEAQLSSRAEEKEEAGKKARHKHASEKATSNHDEAYFSPPCENMRHVEIDPFCGR
eukprot:2408066-Karenia_brevis.AAC.1